MLDEEIDYNFRGRRPNEKVLMVVRYHPWLLMPIAFCWLIIIAVVGLILYFFGASTITSIAIGVFGMFGLIYSFYQWFIWNGGNYIITTQRVIRTEQLGLFRRQIAEAEVGRIQEISTQVSGPIHTLFNFGTVRVRTASGSGQVDIEDVADPYDIQQAIARVQSQLGDQAQPDATVSRPNRIS